MRMYQTGVRRAQVFATILCQRPGLPRKPMDLVPLAQEGDLGR